MRFAPEPTWRHGDDARTAVLLVNLGTPASPSPGDVRRYLAQFLSDPRVVEIPAALWWPILHGAILTTRPRKSAAKYASIWTADGSPLLVWTQRLAEGVQRAFAERGHDVLVGVGMRYGEPALGGALDRLKAAGARRVLVLPLYPQYAASTTATALDTTMTWLQRQRWQPEVRFVNQYHDDDGFIGALAASVRRHWAAYGRGGKLVMSFHGVPERSLYLGDPYHCQCHVTARRLAAALDLPDDAWKLTFQSRFGKAKWLQPYTEPTLCELARSGQQRVDVICPGFACDCLETLEEIAQEAREAFLGAGGREFHYIPALNADESWVAALADIALRHLQGWPTQPRDSGTLASQRERALRLGATG